MREIMNNNNDDNEVNEGCESLIFDKEEFRDRIVDIRNELHDLMLDAAVHGEISLRRALNRAVEPLEDLIFFAEENIMAEEHVCEECAIEKMTQEKKTEKDNKLN